MSDSDRPAVGTQLILPMWAGHQRGIPNAFARSALFTVANLRSEQRTQLKRHCVASLAGVEITYTGEELRQDDQDVFLMLIHMARMHSLDEEIRFTAHAMLTELGWSVCGRSYERLIESIERLKASALAITVRLPDGGRANFTGSMIRAFRWRSPAGDAEQGHLRQWRVLLEPEIVTLFDPGGYTKLQWQLRRKLPPLAKWLHCFYGSHAQPTPYRVETIHRLSGSHIKALRQFRYELAKALRLLVERGFFVTAVIDKTTDLVLVERSRS